MFWNVCDIKNTTRKNWKFFIDESDHLILKLVNLQIVHEFPLRKLVKSAVYLPAKFKPENHLQISRNLKPENQKPRYPTGPNLLSYEFNFSKQSA